MTTKPFKMNVPVTPAQRSPEKVERDQYDTLLAMAVEIRRMPGFLYRGSPAQALLDDMQRAVFSHPIVSAAFLRAKDADD